MASRLAALVSTVLLLSHRFCASKNLSDSEQIVSTRFGRRYAVEDLTK